MRNVAKNIARPAFINAHIGSLLNLLFAIATDSEDGSVQAITTDSEDGKIELILIDTEDR